MESTDQIESIEPIAEQPVEEASAPTQVEEPEAPPPAPKSKKLSKDRLEKLAKARARASEVAKQKRERKAKKPFDEPVVVVEQDESDEDTFEADSPGIIFVRRKRAKKPEPPPANTMSPEMAVLYHSMFGSRSF